MKNRKQKLKGSNGRTALKRTILAAGPILLLFLSTFLPVQKIATNTFGYPSMQPASSAFDEQSYGHKAEWLSPFFNSSSLPAGRLGMSDILSAQRIDLLDASTALKISKLHRIFSEYHTGLSVKEEEQLARLIYQESVRHQYDPELIMAIIFAESSFHNWSTSQKGAIGLMQILPKTGQALAQSNDLPFYSHRSLFDPHLNVKFGVQYLTYLHRRFGDLELALTAYNYGPTRVSQWLSEDQPLPTRYSRKVLIHYKKLLGEETDHRLRATPTRLQ